MGEMGPEQGPGASAQMQNHAERIDTVFDEANDRVKEAAANLRNGLDATGRPFTDGVTRPTGSEMAETLQAQWPTEALLEHAEAKTVEAEKGLTMSGLFVEGDTIVDAKGSLIGNFSYENDDVNRVIFRPNPELSGLKPGLYNGLRWLDMNLLEAGYKNGERQQ